MKETKIKPVYCVSLTPKETANLWLAESILNGRSIEEAREGSIMFAKRLKWPDMDEIIHHINTIETPVLFDKDQIIKAGTMVYHCALGKWITLQADTRSYGHSPVRMRIVYPSGRYKTRNFIFAPGEKTLLYAEYDKPLC